MRITMYELLGMIKDGKAPKTIKSEEHYYNYNELEKDYYEGMGYDYEYLIKNTPNDRLNDEVEIIEENNKIEHIGKIYDITNFKNDYLEAAQLLKDITDKQCEIIDYLKSKGDE